MIKFPNFQPFKSVNGSLRDLRTKLSVPVADEVSDRIVRAHDRNLVSWFIDSPRSGRALLHSHLDLVRFPTGRARDWESKWLEEEAKRPQQYPWPGVRLQDGSIADY
jgi:hypothetical protein